MLSHGCIFKATSKVSQLSFFSFQTIIKFILQTYYPDKHEVPATVNDRNLRFIPEKDILSLRSADWIDVDFDQVQEPAWKDALRRQKTVPGKSSKNDLLYLDSKSFR